jgi:capsular exopolysaccharide synthesis family protein
VAGTGSASLRNLDAHVVSLLEPESFPAEQYRVLRQVVEDEARRRGARVLAVTSAAVGEGKTTTAVNIAASLAQGVGTRVLLVDADLRRPAVARTLGLDEPQGPGLAGVVLDRRRLASSVHQLPAFNLSLLPSGQSRAGAFEVLRSPRLGALLRWARRAYEHVVVDTPPMLVVPDGRALARWVDAFLVVVSAHRTPRKLLAETLDSIAPSRLMGIVFNHDDRPVSGYYEQYYRSYYRETANAARRSRK